MLRETDCAAADPATANASAQLTLTDTEYRTPKGAAPGYFH
jgi:hypothetical protein